MDYSMMSGLHDTTLVLVLAGKVGKPWTMAGLEPGEYTSILGFVRWAREAAESPGWTGAWRLHFDSCICSMSEKGCEVSWVVAQTISRRTAWTTSTPLQCKYLFND
jgi:hypothetical protein